MLRLTHALLVLLAIGNGLAMAFFALMAVSLLIGLPPGMDYAARAALPGQAEVMRRLMLTMFAIGIVTSGAVALIFHRLISILKTVADGLPFLAANGARLRAMAWALLAIQLLDIGFAFVVRGINHTARHSGFSWSPSATGWIAVLLLFVLAQVFVRGAAMQDEIEGTV